MAEMTIRLRVNPETGKKDIIVALHSDDDLLPHEHEQLHRRLVEKLIAGGLMSQDESTELVVERLQEEGVSSSAPVGQEQAEQRSSLSEGA